MKIMKRAAALILICAMLVPAFGVSASEFADSSDVSAETAAKLTAFGILEKDDDLLYETYLTRGAFVEYSARLLGEMQPLKNENPYTDVNEEDSFYESVMLFYELGYISKGELFRPEDEITLEEAAKILLGILGYAPLNSKFSYPENYLKRAHKIDLFDKVDSDGHIDAREMAELMLNVLHIPVLDITAIQGRHDENTVYFSHQGSTTLLEQVFDIYFYRGIIEDNAYTSIYGESDVSEGMTVINGKKFNSGNTGADNMVGYYVKAYYRDNDVDQTLVYIEKDKNKNKVISIKGGDVEEASITPTGFSYRSDEKNRKLDVKTERSVVMIYNGVLHPFDKSFITNENAYITLIDNDGDNKIEIIHVMNYRTAVVASISSNAQITDKLGGSIIDLNPENNDFDVYVTGENGSMTPTEITAGDVISVAVPLGNNPKVKYVLVSRTRIEGAITQYDNDGIYINDVFYEIIPEFNDKSLMGWAGEFLIDAFGSVVHKEIKRDMVYGYLNMIGMDRGTLQAKIFTENNRWVILNFKDKFLFNDSKVSARDFYNTYGASTANYRQLVRYNVNEDAQITRMNFATESAPFSEEHVSKINDDKFRKLTIKSSALFRATVNGFIREIEGGAPTEQLILKTSTKIFMIPYQPENKCADDDEFFIATYSDMVQDQRYKNIIGYDCDEFLQPEACTITDDASFKNNAKVRSSANFLLVTDMRRGYLESGIETDIICGMYSGTEIAIKTAGDEIIETVGGLHPGDVIQFALDHNGNIGTLSKRFDSQNGFTQKIGGSDTNMWSSVKVMGGEVVKHDGGLKRIAVDCGKYSTASAELDRIVVATTNSVSTVYLFDTTLKEARKISADEILPGDYVFGMLSYYRYTQLIVYRP